MPIRYRDVPPPAADLVVIGGGVVGAASAFFAARQGLRVVLLERRPRLCTLTTPASTGAFRLQFDNREELEVVRESARLFLNFAEVTGQSDYSLDLRLQGYVWVTTTEEGVARQRRLVAAQHAWGQTDIELLSGEEARRRFPYLSGNVRQARFRGDDGFLDPRALTMGLTLGSGADVVTSCGATGFRLRGGRLAGVDTNHGTISTETAIIAAGPFSGVVAGWAGVTLPAVTVPRQKLVMPFLPPVPADAPLTIDEDTGVHWRPALQGAYLLFTDPTTPPTPPTEDVTPSHAFAFRLLDPASPVAAARTAPFWADVWERSSAPWFLQAGQYTVTPDHRPLLDQTEVEGLYVNTGYSGHGIMGSPAGSRLLVDLITGRLARQDNPFWLDRRFQPRELDVI